MSYYFFYPNTDVDIWTQLPPRCPPPPTEPTPLIARK